MYELELIVFVLSCYLSYRFLLSWYRPLFSVWPPDRAGTTQFVLQALPPVGFGIILFTLRVLASFDVVGDFFYLLLYILLGFAWIYAGLGLMMRCFDLSWQDDALHLANRAALFPVVSGFLALTLIYSGANIGDGPGWWCVVFAGGLGVAAWLALGFGIGKLTGVFEQITIDRDRACGLRFGGYLLASGLMLARASAGDWTSLYDTVLEFIVGGWPVLLLALLAFGVEWLFSARKGNSAVPSVVGSAALAALYVAMAVIGVMLLPPLVENPIYNGLWAIGL